MAVSPSTVQEELRSGETGQVEFKSTLRWSLKSDRVDVDVAHSAMKAIAGLMNKHGGVLYIGVDNSGVPRGLLSADGYKDDDRFSLLLVDTVKGYLGQITAVSLGMSFHTVNDVRILRIECPAAKQPVYLRRGNLEEFWVRAGTQTVQLLVSQIHGYISDHFRQPAPEGNADDAILLEEFRHVIQLSDSPAEAFRRFAQDVHGLVARGKWVFTIGIGEPPEMAQAETRLRDTLEDFRRAVLAARKAAIEITGTEAIYDSLGDALRHAEQLDDLVKEIRSGLTVSALEADQRYLGFLNTSQVAVGEIRRRYLPNAPSRSPTDYWSMSDENLERLATARNIPPWGRAGKEGEHWYVDRDRIIATLVERDRHLAGEATLKSRK